uniref:SCP domain-containing protein n=1 Tax=Strongyloides papillosus TaxID=174720 RepID=A0A0N5B290_STREA
MFLNFLLFHTIFIISVLKVDGLSGQKQDGDQLVEKKETPSNFRKPQSRFQQPKRTISFSETKVKSFDKNEPPSKVGDKKKQKVPHHSKKYPKGQNQALLRYEELIKRFTLSGKVWYYVWSKCKYYECYSRNNFAALYGRFLEEVNLYRRIHRSRPLQMDAILSRKAMDAAKKSAVLGRLIPNSNPDIGENSIICNEKMAPLIVFNWYKERSKYNYNTLAALPESVHFSNLIWRSATKVGIGIARKGNLLYIIFNFWPETSQNFKFRENVFKPYYNLANSRSLFKM